LCDEYKSSPKTLRKEFDEYRANTLLEFKTYYVPLNIVFDATFFGRNYGILLFRANGKNIYWTEITSESIETISRALDALDSLCLAGYKSFTIDGRRGVIQLLEERYPLIPIQLCQYHQKQIVVRYNTRNPQTECGKSLKLLVSNIAKIHPVEFYIRFQIMRVLFDDFLKERNENNKFVHRRLRSAFRSIKANMTYLFVTNKYTNLNIPNTTNSCEGYFAHWKYKVKIHRGISKERRSHLIYFILSQNLL
jgi:hypothetical protein